MKKNTEGIGALILILVVGYIIFKFIIPFAFFLLGEIGYNLNYIIVFLLVLFLIGINLNLDDENEKLSKYLIIFKKEKIIYSLITLILITSVLKHKEIFRYHPSGKYCAEVYVFNPKTSHDNIYDLIVEVKYGLVDKIFWNNGGVLKCEKFQDEETSGIGFSSQVEFVDDRGREFEVKLINKAKSCKR